MKLQLKQSYLIAAMVAAFTVCQCGSQALAQVDVGFTGGNATTDYNDPLNWDGGAVPGTAAAAVVKIGDTDAPYLNPAVVDLAAAPAGAMDIFALRIGDGNDGDGTFNHSAGDLVATDWSFIGVDAANTNPAIGRYNISGSATFTGNSGPLVLGVSGGAGGSPSQGFLDVSGNAVVNVDALDNGRNDDNEGTVTQSGGAINVNNWVNVGGEGGAIGLYNMTGGSLSAGELSVGQNSGAQGTMNLSGDAIVNITGGARAGRDITGVGAMTITGDQVSFTSGEFSVGSNDGDTFEAEGTLNFVSASAAGISTITSTGDTNLNDGTGTGFGDLFVDLTLGSPAGDILLIDVQGALNGTFRNLAEGALVPNSGGRTITYTYGDGNNVALINAIPEPASVLLLSLGLAVCFTSRRRTR